MGLILPSSVCIRDAKEAFSVRPRFPENFQYMVLDVEDNEEQNLIRLFPSCVTFLVFLCITLTGTTTEPKSSSTMRFDQGGLCLFIAMVRRLVKSTSLIQPIFIGGISLSPAFVVMFVMQHYQLSWEDALHLVQNRRYCISPNGGFLTQIKVRSSPTNEK